MIEPVKPAGGWKSFPDPKPYITTSGFAFDRVGRFPILFRGPNVRSARNIWSLPSGLHECGLTLAQQFSVELKEECNLDANINTVTHFGVYENIAPDIAENQDNPQWHWVIHVLGIGVETLDTFVNKEPDKHPEVRMVTLDELGISVRRDPWHPTLRDFIIRNFDKISMYEANLRLARSNRGGPPI